MEPTPPKPRKVPKLTVEQVWRALRAAVENPSKWDIGISWAFRHDYWVGRAAIDRIGKIAVPALNSDELARYRFARNRKKPHVALIAAIGLLPMHEGGRPNFAWLVRLSDRIARRLDHRPLILDGSNVVPFPKRSAVPPIAAQAPATLMEPQQSA
ncbi:MAG TPA: hypothetical protein VH722_17890 [Alphaproteobacteria bacterium]|jgi:hypothetical protein|nr:hypothetical protein [Alphaproteobacteria bacterium]